VAIARALVSHPALVLADEPTAALDSKSGRNLVELMRQLAREQGLMVTHDRPILVRVGHVALCAQRNLADRRRSALAIG